MMEAKKYGEVMTLKWREGPDSSVNIVASWWKQKVWCSHDFEMRWGARPCCRRFRACPRWRPSASPPAPSPSPAPSSARCSCPAFNKSEKIAWIHLLYSNYHNILTLTWTRICSILIHLIFCLKLPLFMVKYSWSQSKQRIGWQAGTTCRSQLFLLFRDYEFGATGC